MKVIVLAVMLWTLSASSSAHASGNTANVISANHRTTQSRFNLLGENAPARPASFLGTDPEETPLDLDSSALLERPEFPRSVGADRGEDITAKKSSSFLKPALFVGGSLAITAALIRTDQSTYNIIHGWRMKNDPIEDTSPVITNLGDGRASMAIFGGFLAYSYLEKDRTAFEAGKIGLESFLVSGVVTQILKHTFGRQRPSTATQSGGRWNGAFLLLNQGSGKRGSYAQFDAFPSGHTATIFAAASTLAEVYDHSRWVSYASYAVASSVAISRVMERDHWLSDCFVGGLIGYFSTEEVLHFNRSKEQIALLPVYDGRSTGLALNVSF